RLLGAGAPFLRRMLELVSFTLHPTGQCSPSVSFRFEFFGAGLLRASLDDPLPIVRAFRFELADPCDALRTIRVARMVANGHHAFRPRAASMRASSAL